MSALENFTGKFKQFGPTSWSIKNKTSIYLLMLIITLIGVNQFVTLPKEQFPDIVIPTIYVQTIYVGNSPRDIENLVTQPIEKQIKGITGAKITKTTSTSVQDYSAITVEFDTDVKTDIALQKVKDAVDKAKQDLPTDLTQQPTVLEVSFSDFPIMYVNISGDYDLMRLKQMADETQDRLEELSQLNRVDLVGAPEREFQVNVDNYRMQAANVSFDDIANAISRENMDISGGLLDVGNTKRSIQLKGQLKTSFDIEQIVVRNAQGNPIYLRDIANVRDTVKETESYARLNGKKVITLNIIKRAGENLIETSDAVKKTIEELQATYYPKDLNVVVTGDLSKPTRTSFNDLVNSIVIGFILVLIILMFFMGVTNAFFVALSVPLSVFVAFMFLPIADIIIGSSVTLNFIVLFALLFGLGIIVDDAIVVIENTHRIYRNGKVPIVRSAKEAAGEVFIPVMAGTATTLAPFFPLLFWKGLIGKFMIYLPTILILTLAASLIVAFIFNPVFAVSFMKPEGKEYEKPKSKVFTNKWFLIFAIAGVLLHLGGSHGMANFLLLMAILMVLNSYVFNSLIHLFQKKALPSLMNSYEKLLRWVLKGWRPVKIFASLFLLFVIALAALMFSMNSGRTKQTFFPSGDPNFIYVYLKMPVGTDVKSTDSITHILEKRVQKVLENELPGKPDGIVESIITNIAVSANNPRDNNRSVQSNLGRIQVSFLQYDQRHGKRTRPFMDSIRVKVQGIPGTSIEVAQEDGGPPTDPPVNVEVTGDNFESISKIATQLLNYLDTNRIKGIENLQANVDLNNPEISINVDRERAMLEGLTTGQIGMEVRTAVFGKEISKLKDGEDEYKIQLRYSELKRNSITDLMNLRITFMDMNTFKVKSVPLSAVATVDYTNTTGGIKRKNVKRTIQLQSNVLDPTMVPIVNAELQTKIDDFKAKTAIPSDITLKLTGQSEQELETQKFLGTALMISLGIIFLILVLQFNSMSKPFIVITEIFFSIIGVLLGYAITGMTIATIMLGVGIVGLAGIVIKNGILLIEFTDELRGRGMRTREAAVQAGKIRIIPVLLTAVATILGLLPLAVGFNIDFGSLFTHLKPNIFFGGDSVVFWGPLSWTIIFGLIFAFFLTLMMVPSMYLIAERLRRPMSRFYGTKFIAILGFLGPFFFIFAGLMFLVRRIMGKPVWMGKMKETKK